MRLGFTFFVVLLTSFVVKAEPAYVSCTDEAAYEAASADSSVGTIYMSCTDEQRATLQKIADAEAVIAKNLRPRAGKSYSLTNTKEGKAETYQGKFQKSGKACNMTFEWYLEDYQQGWHIAGLTVHAITSITGHEHSYSYWTSDFSPMPILNGPKITGIKNPNTAYQFGGPKLRVGFSSSDKPLYYKIAPDNKSDDICVFDQ